MTKDKPFTDKLIELFQKLDTLCNVVFSKDSALYEECQEEAKNELRKEKRTKAKKLRAEAKKKAQAAAKASGLSSSGGYSSSGVNRSQEITIKEPTQWEINSKANEKYLQADPKYVQRLSQAEQQAAEVAKQINHTLLLPSVQRTLLSYTRAKNTLLAISWQEVRKSLSLNTVLAWRAKGKLRDTIEGLEIIKANQKLQQGQEQTPEEKAKKQAEKETPRDNNGKEKQPDDLITLLVAVKDYNVTRITLQRKIKAKKIKSYRPKNATKNTPHIISRTDIEKFYNKRN